jgi:hypothetical protein
MAYVLTDTNAEDPMGWTGLHRNAGLSDRAFFQAELPSDAEIVACATVRGTFYAAVRQRDTGEVWGLVALLRRSGGEINFYYKIMNDSEGPGEDSAPAAVLDALTPTDSKWANEWRGRCRANLAKRAARPVVRRGDLVAFETPLQFANGDELATLRFIERSTFAHPETGQRYRISRWRDRRYAVARADGPCPEPTQVASAAADE